jgi:hypothetical protein
MAEELDCSPFGLDNALNTAMARGVITHRVEIADGNVRSRQGMVKLRYYDPCDELVRVYDRAPKISEAAAA